MNGNDSAEPVVANRIIELSIDYWIIDRLSNTNQAADGGFQAL